MKKYINTKDLVSATTGMLNEISRVFARISKTWRVWDYKNEERK